MNALFVRRIKAILKKTRKRKAIYAHTSKVIRHLPHIYFIRRF